MASTRDLLCLHLLFSIVCPTTAKDDKINDVEVQHKCGFSLKAIHDCKNTLCINASASCFEEHPNSIEEASNCQLKICMDNKKLCEAPLNKYLSKAEQCEGDGFADIDTNCVLVDHSSMETISKCKQEGYLKVKRTCFESEWRRRIEVHAVNEMKIHALSKEAEHCAYNHCFKSVEQCLSSHHKELALNPGSKRKFDISVCAYVAIDYPYECEKIETIPDCVASLSACIKDNPAPAPFPIGIVIGVVAGMALVAVLILLFVMRKRRWGPFRGPGQT